MKSLLIFLTLLLLAASPSSALAQEQEFETILIPIATAWEFEGAYGTRWQHDVRIFNDTDERITYRKAGCDLLVPECNYVSWIGPRETQPLVVTPVLGTPGAFIHVPADVAGHLHFGRALRDLSGAASALGTELPVVRASAFSSRIILIHPSLSDSVRMALRVYGFDSEPSAARIRIFDSGQPEPLVDMIATLAPALFWWDKLPDHPSYFELDVLGTFPALVTAGPLRIEIDAIEPDAKLWAFSSVTNNLTQELTVVTPR